jgi:predicted metal-dependent hydrolase
MISIQDFKSEVLRWAEDIDVRPKEIHLRNMSRKWASCSRKGRLTFSSSLLYEPLEVRTKVIVHELLHLKYPSHGKMFKTLFVSYLRKQGIDASLKDFNLRVNS